MAIDYKQVISDRKAMKVSADQGNTHFLTLKNDQGDEVFIIDRFDDALVVSPMKQNTNQFETLTVYNMGGDELCKLSLAEIFVTAIYDALQRNGVYGTSINKYQVGDVTTEQFIESYEKEKILFREFSDCIGQDKTYKPPKAEEVFDELNRSVMNGFDADFTNNMLWGMGVLSRKTPYVKDGEIKHD